MQVNILMSGKEDFESLREHYFPGTTGTQTRDSFILGYVADNFNAQPEELIPYLRNEPGVQRLFSLRATTIEVLDNIATQIKASRSAVARALIAYEVAEVKNKATAEQTPCLGGTSAAMISERITAIEEELKKISRMFNELKDMCDDTTLNNKEEN